MQNDEKEVGMMGIRLTFGSMGLKTVRSALKSVHTKIKMDPSQILKHSTQILKQIRRS